MQSQIKIAILASGSGSNALKIIEYFQEHPQISVEKVFCNNSKAGIIDKCGGKSIPCRVFNKEEWINDALLNDLKAFDYLILAGFLKLIPTSLIELFPEKIINIHPSLLPKYGGKGMFGNHVHDAVSNSGDTQSGMTIHLVNAKYDDGRILFQEKIEFPAHANPDHIARMVLQLEHRYYAPVIHYFISEKEGLDRFEGGRKVLLQNYLD